MLGDCGVGWCGSSQINCFLISVNEKDLQYCSINVYRSAISALPHTIDGVVIGKHTLVSKFMKGVSCLHPPKQKYCVLGR